MNPKCRCCGKELKKDEAFKVVVGKKNTYYCNEAEYLPILQKRQDKDDIYLLINEIFGYKVMNSALFKEISLLHEVYEYSHILAYIKENIEDIKIYMDKDFTSEYAKIRYFAAILKNNLRDFAPKEPEGPKEVEVEVDMPIINYKRKKKRRSLSDIESEVY